MIKVYVDAAFKNNLATGAYVIYDGKTQYTHAFDIHYVTTNHDAEFITVITVLNDLIKQHKQTQTVALYCDSLVVVKAMQRQSAKNNWQQPYIRQLVPLMNEFQLLIVDWYNEKENQLPHQLAQRQLINLQKKKESNHHDFRVY